MSVPSRTDDELLAAMRRLARASDVRRRTVERVLHDGVQQHLAMMGVKLHLLRAQITKDPQQAEALCGELRDDLLAALSDLRAHAQAIYPPLLEGEGLLAALRHAASRIDSGVDIEVEPVTRYAADVEAAVYFCCQAMLESASGPVRIRIAEEDGRLTVSVDGIAPGDDQGDGSLQHIRDRFTALGGVVDAGATSVWAAVPLP